MRESEPLTRSSRNSTTTSFAKQAVSVWKAWMKRPAVVATILPSSPFLTQNIADRECVREASVVVELGPGSGGTTAALLEQMREDSRLLAIEKMPAFKEALDEIADPRLIAEIGDAADLSETLKVHALGRPDLIVSGIPFSSLPAEVATAILQSVHQALRPGGTFIAYQVRSDVEKFALPLFGPPRRELIAMNLPPLKVFTWRKSTR